VPPEIVAQLEAQQKLQDSMQPQQAAQQRPGAAAAAEQQHHPQQQQQQHPQQEHHHAQQQDGGGGGGGGAGQSFYKTRLCIKYMQTGYCHKAGTCTFAHGYEDLRQPGTPISPGRMPQVWHHRCRPRRPRCCCSCR
jgi:hypothetical protein